MPEPRPSGRRPPPDRARRTPEQARPLALTAAWAGLASALVGCVVAIAVVSVLWLPASGGSGSADSAIRAGILTFLAGIHGGVTVDGVATAFVPLGLTVLAGYIVWRAATAVAGAAAERDEDQPVVLVGALVTQTVVYAVVCALLAAWSSLGTSHASVIGAFVAGAVSSAVIAGVAMLRHTTLGDDAAQFVPPWLSSGLRCAVAGVAVYSGAGALLVAGSLVVHHDRVASLSHEVGGGWSSVPVLVLGVLAAPNAAIAGAGVLSGVGVAVGSGTTVGLTGVTTGVVPAFPILGALPSSGGSVLVWLVAAATPLIAGGAVAGLAGRADAAGDRWRVAGASAVLTVPLAAVLAWQGGGAIGGGRLSAVGVSPWQYGLWTALWTGLAAAVLLGVRTGVEAASVREQRQRPSLRDTIAALASVEQYGEPDDADSRSGDVREADTRGDVREAATCGDVREAATCGDVREAATCCDVREAATRGDVRDADTGPVSPPHRPGRRSDLAG